MLPTRQNVFRIVSKCLKMSQNVKKCPSRLWEKMVGNDWENSLNAPNSSKSLLNCPKMSHNVPSCPKMSQVVPKCPEMSQNAHFRRIVVRRDLFLELLTWSFFHVYHPLVHPSIEIKTKTNRHKWTNRPGWKQTVCSSNLETEFERILKRVISFTFNVKDSFLQ